MLSVDIIEQQLIAGSEVPIIDLVDYFVEKACRLQASDIHIYPISDGLRIRFRVDGILQDVCQLSQKFKTEIISRIKVLAGLRTDEHQMTQDGRFRYSFAGGKFVDIRVAIAPTYHGENAVLRLLFDNNKDFTLETLGFNEANQKKIIQAIKDEYSKMKGQIVATLFGNENSDSAASSGTVQDPKAFDETKEIPGLPDYWNAENTAQRIVDFATSFLKDFQGGTDEFVSMIKDAIEKGFSQAKDILGKDLPDPVTKLVAKTHALVMEKIDNWAKAQSASTADANDGSSAA